MSQRNRSPRKLAMQAVFLTVLALTITPMLRAAPTLAAESREAVLRLHAEGRQALSRGDYPAAEKLFQTSAAAARELKDLELEAVSLQNLGIVYTQKGELDKALEVLKPALELREKTKDKRGAAAVLNNLGNIYLERGEIPTALELHTRSLQLKREAGAREDIPYSLLNLGRIHQDQGRYEQALQHFGEALDLYREFKKDPEAASTLNNIGNVHLARGELQKAWDTHQEALAIRLRVGDPNFTAFSYFNLARVSERQGRFERAFDSLSQARELWAKAGARGQLAGALDFTGSLYYYLGQHEKALDYYRQSREAGDPKNRNAEGNYWANVGNVYMALADFEKARQSQEQAAAIFDQIGNRPGYANALMSLGTVYLYLGRYDRVFDLQSRSLKLWEGMGQKGQIATGNHNLANLYRAIGQPERSVQLLRRAVALEEESGDEYRAALSRQNLAMVLRELGKIDEAEQALEKCRQVIERVNEPEAISAFLSEMGMLRLDQNKPTEALELLQKSLALREKSTSRRSIATSLAEMGLVLRRLRRLVEAKEYLEKRITLLGDLGNRDSLASTRYDLAQLYRQLKSPDKAEEAYRACLKDYEAVTDELPDPTQIGNFQQRRFDPYGAYAALKLSQGKHEEALVLTERGRARGLARQAALSRVELRTLLSGQDAADLDAARSGLVRAGKMLRASQSRVEPGEPAEKRAYQSQLSDAQKRYREAEQRFTTAQAGALSRSGAYRKIQGAVPPSISELKALATRNPDTLFLQWSVPERGPALLFALSAAKGLKAYTLPESATVAKVAKWRSALVENKLTEPAEARSAYAALLDPAEKDGLLSFPRFKRLVVVTDGSLTEVPISALMNAKGARLFERFSISSTLSFGALSWPAVLRKAESSLLVIADPGGEAEAAPQVASRAGLGRLEHARVEGRNVAQLFSGSRQFVGSAAREAEVKKTLGKYRLLHFATHGVLDSTSGLSSWLLLAPEAADGAEDGRLEAREILSLPLAADLAVLSACEAARGSRSGGDGLLGLAWSFRAAGCPSVVASHWKVNDAATARLMETFYKGLKAGQTKDAALRSAMLSLKKDPRYSRPYYWAAFSILGDTRPIRLP